tara:strand:- start:2888 stop:4195 length:1308 start_codon:yes stop_codon:yes gene_type:complete
MNFLASVYGLYNTYRKSFNKKKYIELIDSRKCNSRSDWKKIQEIELQKILKSAKENVPFYIDYWNKSSLDWKNLENWPIMNKDTIRGNELNFIDVRFKRNKLIKMYTSGSSGRPMCYYFTKEAFSYWYSVYDVRIKSFYGIDIETDSYATFGGRILFKSNKMKPPFWIWNNYNKQLYCSSYHLNQKNIIHYLREFKKRDIKYIVSYVSSLHAIALYILKKKPRINLKIKLIVTNAEPLYDYQRNDIENAFNCKVIETYSGCELAFGGNQMFGNKITLWPEVGIMQILTANGEITDYGKGEFLITGLLNQAMPLIKYRIGDFGELDKSSLNGFQFLKNIEGRVDDVLISDTGNLVGRMDPVFKDSFDIKEAQIVQLSERLVKVNIVKGERFSKTNELELTKNIKDRLGDSMCINFNYLDSIPRGANGKFKGVISKI